MKFAITCGPPAADLDEARQVADEGAKPSIATATPVVAEATDAAETDATDPPPPAEVPGSDLEAGAAKFHDSATFNTMTVTGNAEFDGATFSDSADFTQAHIQQNLVADDARFENLDEQADFTGVTVERDASFKKTIFRGPAVFSYADLNKAILDETEFHSLADFGHAKFGTLELKEVDWPADREHLLLEQISYERLVPGDGANLTEKNSRDRWSPAFEWLQRAAFSAKAYGELEKSLEAGGRPELADEAYMERKRRERDGLPGLSIKRAANHLLERAVAYGRKPHLAFLWSAVVVFIGYLVFCNPRDVQLRDSPGAEASRLQQFDALFAPDRVAHRHPFKPYHPLWFSLDLFLPFVNLHAAEVWMPRQDQRLRKHYARFHTILGWILIPIALASITGIVK